MHWETTRDSSISFRFARGEFYFFSDVSLLKSKIAVLKNILKGLSPHTSLISQTSMCPILFVKPYIIY